MIAFVGAHPDLETLEFRQMKYLISAALATTVTFGAGAVLADVAVGTVREVNEGGHTIALDNGHQFNFPETAHLEVIHPGENVTITYTLRDGRREVASITVQYDH